MDLRGRALQQASPIQGEELTVAGFLDSAFDWIEFGELIKTGPERLSPDAEACRKHMTFSLSK